MEYPNDTRASLQQAIQMHRTICDCRANEAKHAKYAYTNRMKMAMRIEIENGGWDGNDRKNATDSEEIKTRMRFRE